jgi:hypothetical protein
MKISMILAICFIASTMAVVPACAAASHCKSCSTTTSTACTGCYNYKGDTGPRYLSAAACKNKVTAIKHCKIYDDSLNAAATNKEGACWMCDFGEVILETTTGNDVAITCPKTRPILCAAIANCKQQECKTSDAGTTYTTACVLCESYFGASAANACAGNMMPNCYHSFWSSTVQGCTYPKSGYVAASDKLSVIAYTTDVNCQVLASGSTTQCQTCWDGYYWASQDCKLSANLLGAGFFFAVGLFIN